MRLKEAIAWCAGSVVTVAAAIAFLFSTFQTNAAAKDTASYFDQRLDRLEAKIDQLIKLNK